MSVVLRQRLFCESSTARPVEKGNQMLGWSVAFFALAVIAAFFGFFGLAGTAASIAQLLFFIFLALLIVSFLVRAFTGRSVT